MALGGGKRRLKRIQWDIVTRLVIIIRHHPKLKKTNIAMKSGLAYDKCVLYLDWMERMDLIRRETDEDGFQTISLADKGNELYTTEFRDMAKSKKLVLAD